MKEKKQVILTILDGWGYSALTKGNAIASANTPFYKSAWENYPHTLLDASAESVGLRWGELGGSQVGHSTIGTGRVIPGFLTTITEAINNKSFYNNPALKGAIIKAQTKQTSLHIAGLMSAGGVHSHIEHLASIFQMIKKIGFTGPVFIHCFTDGRDTSAKIAEIYIKKINEWISEYNIWGRIASISGRYYAMDRDQRWERTAQAYKAMINDQTAKHLPTAEQAIKEAYKDDKNDEFIYPTVIDKNANLKPPHSLFGGNYYGSLKDGGIKNNDSVIFLNFRSDRMRQIVQLFLMPPPDNIKITPVNDVEIVTMTEYNNFFNVKVAFKRDPVTNTLSDAICNAGMTQLHIAETEKYAHVTYFFNAEKADRHKDEDWIITPSPKVDTYDKTPEMSANEITANLLKACNEKFYNFIVINYANADMVGHTGDFNITVKAIECVDKQLQTIATKFPDATLIITADHGNAEQMIDPKTSGIDKEHSLNPIPFLIIDPLIQSPQDPQVQPTKSGILADIAPTILEILNLPKPKEMSGSSLLEGLNIDPKILSN